jgi:hypothetical protein
MDRAESAGIGQQRPGPPTGTQSRGCEEVQDRWREILFGYRKLAEIMHLLTLCD